jgi:hypothetical protein
MSDVVRQGLLVAGFSVLFVFGIVTLARRRLLSFRYTIGWLALGGVGLLAAMLTGLVQPLADVLGVTPTSVFALAGTGILLIITVQLSISVSGLQAQVRQLAEALALLDSRLDDARSVDDH